MLDLIIYLKNNMLENIICQYLINIFAFKKIN
ncbi:hypothetical protein ACJIZ3_023741 [Penstemon smallii]|uniref:Uncharacterized protein n=1 Tax=Penstemon smallii TaxID=265156 RepID=A0ABD3S410_9LAMI